MPAADDGRKRRVPLVETSYFSTEVSTSDRQIERLFLSQCLPLPSAEAALCEAKSALPDDNATALRIPELVRAYCSLFEDRLTLKTEIAQAIKIVAALCAAEVISRDDSFFWQNGNEGIPLLVSRISGTEFNLMSAVYMFFERSAEHPLDVIERMLDEPD